MSAERRLDALVLDADTRAGLTMARALGRAGLRVGVAASDPRAAGLSTRYAAVRATLPDPGRDVDAYARCILDVLARHPADVVLTSIDAGVVALDARRAAFEAVTSPALASHDALQIALSKPRTLAVARELGIPTPRTVEIERLPQVVDAVAEIGLPAVLKPADGWQADGVGGAHLPPVLLGDAADVETASRLEWTGRALVQELATGLRETHKLFRVDGDVRARLVMLSSRTWPPLGGSSVMRWTAAPPGDSLPMAEALAAAVGVDGYSEVEFRRAADGRPLLMEINARLSQSLEVALRAGMDFTRMQLEWARGGAVVAPARYVYGVRVGWLAGDLRLVAAATLGAGPHQPRPALPDTLRSIARDYTVGLARIDGLALADPRPALGSLALLARSALRRGRS